MRDDTKKKHFVAYYTTMMYMDDRPRFSLRATLIGAILLLAIGFFIGNSRISAEKVVIGPDEADLAPLFRVWKLLDENFAAPSTSTERLTREQKVFGAVSGLTAAYGDPYTVFLPPAEKEFFDTAVAGDFQGVGMEVGIRENILTVIAPLKETPAYRAGIQSGDKIFRIDDTETQGMSVEKAVSLIRGKKGTEVKLLLQRDEEEPFDVSVVRDTIQLPTIDTKLREDGVFVISLYSFNAISPDLFRKALVTFADSGSDKLILDLRGNPGGYLEVAVDMASWFLPVGKPIVLEDFGAKEDERAHRSRGYNVFSEQLKLVILIDGGSASASEILAGALHDHGKATLIGEKSFGKGSVQQVFDVTQNSSLKVTVAQWLTPNRVSISHAGIKPDIEVSLTPEDRKAGRDPQMEKAAEYLKNL